MDKSDYPFLRNSGVIHLDVSAAFPLHERVIAAVNDAMRTTLGAPGKASYASSLHVTEQTEKIRKEIADFLNADISELFFTASATDAVKLIADVWAKNAKVLYSPEDHSRIVTEIVSRSAATHQVAYLDTGEYNYDALKDLDVDVAFVSSLHHVYGSSNNLQTIRRLLPNAKLAVDASQSVSRERIDVKKQNLDTLFFSSQKVGGIAGIGVLYVAKRHHDRLERSLLEPNTIPYIPLTSLSAAIAVLQEENLNNIAQNLAKTTAQFIEGLQINPAVMFAKGPAYPEYTCYGSGIISFTLDGYTSQDVAMILDEQGVQVRAGDHCIDPMAVRQDVIRISAHQFTSDEDIEKVVKLIQAL